MISHLKMNYVLFVQPSSLQAARYDVLQTSFSHCAHRHHRSFRTRTVSSSIPLPNRTDPQPQQPQDARIKHASVPVAQPLPTVEPLSILKDVVEDSKSHAGFNVPKPARRLSAIFIIIMAVAATVLAPSVFSQIGLKSLSKITFLQHLFSRAIVLRAAARLVAIFFVRVLLWVTLFLAGSAVTAGSVSAASHVMVGNNSAN